MAEGGCKEWMNPALVFVLSFFPFFVHCFVFILDYQLARPHTLLPSLARGPLEDETASDVVPWSNHRQWVSCFAFDGEKLSSSSGWAPQCSEGLHIKRQPQAHPRREKATSTLPGGVQGATGWECAGCSCHQHHCLVMSPLVACWYRTMFCRVETSGIWVGRNHNSSSDTRKCSQWGCIFEPGDVGQRLVLRGQHTITTAPTPVFRAGVRFPLPRKHTQRNKI